MKKFDFRRKLKGLDLDGLKSLKDYHLDLMLGFIGYNDKEASKKSRYIQYIDNAINTIILATQKK